MTSGDYKIQKEAFHSFNNGDTVLDINKICWTAITTYQLWKIVHKRTSAHHGKHGYRHLVLDYILLVVPLLLVLTIYSKAPVVFNAGLYAFMGVLTLLPRKVIPRKRADEKEDDRIEAISPADGNFRKSFVTVWRAHMMLMTIICILAVDFPAFPRSFGKTESWGTSLMDLGVGSFVFSLGLTSAPALLKRIGTRQSPPPMIHALRRTAIIFLLGLIRVVMVKGTEYPEHVTEYGVHWNFFFTLTLLPIPGALAERWSHKLSFRNMALIITAIHQLLLVVTPLQDYTLNDKRPNLLAMNKEGLVSFTGYLAIYLLGYDTGLYVLPPDPYYIHRKDKQEGLQKSKDGKRLNVLFSYSVIWWLAFGVIHLYLPQHYEVSRRLANSAYVLWVVAFNVSFLCLYLAVDTFQGPTAQSSSDAAPALFQALNKNSLAVFLLANLLTGLVNMSMQTMYLSDFVAVSILLVYSSVLSSFAWYTRKMRLKL